VISIMLLLSVILSRAREGAAVSKDRRGAMGRCFVKFRQIVPSFGPEALEGKLRPFASFRMTKRRPGFTLLELAVVLLIIGLVLAIAMPRFGAFQGAELRSEAHRLAARSHYLYEEAGAQKVLLRLNFDLNHSTYFVTRLDPFAPNPSFMPEKGPAGGVVTMPADVRLRDVWVEGGGVFHSGIVTCQFYPGGVADAAVIHLFDRRGDVITLGIDPFNGAVAIISGDLSPIALQKEARSE
jgi:prepilin-type N-terminal cleavage/methylation domain-containing protein